MKKILLPLLMFFCACLASHAQNNNWKDIGKSIVDGIDNPDSYNVDLKSGKIKGMVKGIIPLTVKGLTVKVNRCIGMENTLFIDMVFSNNTGSDIEHFSISNNDAQAYDDDGKTIKAENIKVAIGNESMSSSSSSTLPNEVSIKVHLRIENVSESATKIKRLGLCLNAEEIGIKSKPLWFKNLAITRE